MGRGSGWGGEKGREREREREKLRFWLTPCQRPNPRKAQGNVLGR